MRFLLCLLLLSSQVWAKGTFDVKDFKEPVAMTLKLAKKHGPKKVIAVFDIDNTLLAMKQDFGSDQWFGWQSGLIKNQKLEMAVDKSFQSLLDINEKIFAVSTMRLTQKDIPSLIQKLQKQGITVIALTSRSPNLRNSTERELRRNKVDLTKTTIGTGIPAAFIPTGHKRLVSFMNGVYMTSGQHKGKMLKYLMDHFKKTYSGVVFVDDHKKHTKAVFKTFGKDTDVNVYRYGKEDPLVERFKAADKKAVTKTLRRFQKFLKEEFAN